MDEALDEWLRAQQRDLSLFNREGDEFSDVRNRAREFARQHLEWPSGSNLTDSLPSDPKVLSQHVHRDFVEEQILFNGVSPMRVPATVLIPRGASRPCPGVVALHDMGGFRVFGREKLLAFDGEPEYLTEFRLKCYEGISIMAELALHGYVVIAIDAFNFGERTMEAARDLRDFRLGRLQMDAASARQFSVDVSSDEEKLVRNIMTVGRTWPGLIVADDRRTVDYLCRRVEVDPDRIGCVGLSFGAYRANYLGALDERVKAAVSVCWTSTMDAVVGYNVVGAMGWFAIVPWLFQRMDLPDLQALAAPRAFMAISGWHDQLMQPFGIAKAHLNLRKCFENARCPQQLASLVYDAPHEFNHEMQEDAFAWLDEHLHPGD